jgi:NDP-sugar pyrophosphorylase family protein
MSPTSPNAFFLLEEFEHKQLFTGSEHVWDALKNLPSYLDKQKLGTIEVELPKGVHLEDAHLISIRKGCVIEPGSFIQGPCILGEGTVVRNGAYIRGHVITGKNAVIGHSTEVKNSIFLNHAAAPHFNYVGDSILGNHTNLGAGVVCSNLRLDKKMISIIIAGQVFPTELQKLGLIIGDGSQMGCNAVANPGTILGKDVFCYPCVNVGGWIPGKTIVKGQHFSVGMK